MSKIVLMPKEGEHGVFLFFKRISRKWFFMTSPEYTCDSNDACVFSTKDEEESIVEYLKKKNPDRIIAAYDDSFRESFKNNIFWIIERGDGMYYSHDDIHYVGKVAKPVPQYAKDIMDACFLKSVNMAAQTLTRLRQSDSDKVRTRMVYLTEKNDFTIPFVLFALTNKQTKRTRYLKGYNLEGKSSDRLSFVDSMDKAWKVTVPMAVNVVDDIHAKHKVFVVNTHIYDGKDIPADKYKIVKAKLFSDFKFKK